MVSLSFDKWCNYRESHHDMQKILYIEDSAVNTYIVKKIIKSIGYKMIPAYDGAEGITKAEQETPDLILIDLILPDVHGRDLIKHLRSMSQFEETPIIALTATDSPTMKDECLVAGFDDYLEKPVSQTRLVNTIEKYLGMSV